MRLVTCDSGNGAGRRVGYVLDDEVADFGDAVKAYERVTRKE